MNHEKFESAPKDVLWILSFDPATKAFARRCSFRLSEQGVAVGEGDAEMVARLSEDGVLDRSGKLLRPADGQAFLEALTKVFKNASLTTAWESK